MFGYVAKGTGKGLEGFLSPHIPGCQLPSNLRCMHILVLVNNNLSLYIVKIACFYKSPSSQPIAVAFAIALCSLLDCLHRQTLPLMTLLRRFGVWILVFYFYFVFCPYKTIKIVSYLNRDFMLID